MPNHFELRPIGARALKSAVDTLRPHLAGAKVCDLFAGEGRFGFSTLSEGAASATFVELGKPQLNTLRKEASKWPNGATVIARDANQYLRGCRETFDILFADPPYPLWDGPFTQTLFEGVARCAAPGAIFLVKHPSRMLLSASHSAFSEWKRSRFGEADLIYFHYEPPHEQTSPR